MLFLWGRDRTTPRNSRNLFSSMNLGPSALQRTSALLRNSACLCRRSIAGRAALVARQGCPASRWRVVLGIPTPTVGLLLVPAGTVFRMAFLASLRDALVWPVPVPGVPLGPPRRTASLYPRLISCHPSGMALGTPAGLSEASLERIPKGCGDISRFLFSPAPHSAFRTPHSALQSVRVTLLRRRGASGLIPLASASKAASICPGMM